MLSSSQKTINHLKRCIPMCLKANLCRRLTLKSSVNCSSKSNEIEKLTCIQPDIKKAVSETLSSSKREYHEDALKVLVHNSTLSQVEYPDIGQPTPYTHPHLFTGADQVTPGLTHKEYAERREKLMILLSKNSFGRSSENHVVILAASALKIMTNDIPYPFHQDTDFLYLTGLNEPDAVAAIEYNTNTGKVSYFLFVKPKDPRKELWDGPVIGVDQAKKYLKCDEAFSSSSLRTVLMERFGKGSHTIWLKKHEQCKNQTQILNVVNSTSFSKKGVFTIGHNLQMLRLIKSPKEIELMKGAASIGAKAFVKVMKSSKPGLTEGQLHALLEFECRVRGAQHLSFPPVVASGNRANTLHYINNTQVIQAGDLILMDGGCEFNGYVSDITRTWPVNGKFTKEQAIIYKIVLAVQDLCIKACKSGVSIDYLHKLMMSSFGEKLTDSGIISSTLSEIEVSKIVSKLCPHHLGHYLGMDTHDTPLIHRGLPLQPGMVFTMEPGLYIPHSLTEIPKQFRGIGIRVEDDVVMTENGPYIITGEIPKRIEDIEQLMSR